MFGIVVPRDTRGTYALRERGNRKVNASPKEQKGMDKDVNDIKAREKCMEKE